VLEIQYGEAFAINPNGTAVPELVGGYHGLLTPLRNASSQRSDAPENRRRRRDIIA
jgi:hypothetical protein